MKKLVILISAITLSTAVLATPQGFGNSDNQGTNQAYTQQFGTNCPRGFDQNGPRRHHMKGQQNGPQGFRQNRQQNPQGFSYNATPTDVKTIMASGIDEQCVKLEGSLTKQINKDAYEFTDLNGDVIVIELDDDRNWNFINKDQKIAIYGQIDKDDGVTSIEVNRADPL